MTSVEMDLLLELPPTLHAQTTVETRVPMNETKRALAVPKKGKPLLMISKDESRLTMSLAEFQLTRGTPVVFDRCPD
jgi:hypothetical protein